MFGGTTNVMFAPNKINIRTCLDATDGKWE